MGGRGASSGGGTTKTISLEKMMGIASQKGMPSISFGKTITLGDGIHIPKTYNLTKGFEKIKGLNKAVVSVDKGFLGKRINQLKDSGFKVKYQTGFKKNDPPYKTVHLYISK